MASLKDLLGGGSVPYSGDIINQIQGLQGAGQFQLGQAGNLAGIGGQLLSPELTGNLPAGAEAEVDLSTQNALNQIKSRYGSLGQTGSTMEADQLAYINQQKAALQFQIAQQMAQQGIQAFGLSNQAAGGASSSFTNAGKLYGDLAQDQISQDKELMQAIAAFAGAIGAGMGGGNPFAALGKGLQFASSQQNPSTWVPAPQDTG